MKMRCIMIFLPVKGPNKRPSEHFQAKWTARREINAQAGDRKNASPFGSGRAVVPAAEQSGG